LTEKLESSGASARSSFAFGPDSYYATVHCARDAVVFGRGWRGDERAFRSKFLGELIINEGVSSCDFFGFVAGHHGPAACALDDSAASFAAF